MRILFCNYEYPPLGGGGGVINKQVAEELAKQHEVSVLTSQGMGLPQFAIENGVKVYRVPVFFRSRQAAANFPSMMAYLPSAYLKGRRLVQQEKFDVINTHFVVPTGPVGDWLSSYADIPNVLSLHGGDLYDPSKFTSPHRHGILRSLVRHLLHRAEVVVGQSTNTLQNVRDYYDPKLPCECIPLGIVRPESQEVARRADYGLPEDAVVLTAVGRLVARKAVEQLVQMVKDLGDPKVHLMVMGSGPQQPPLEQLARDIGVSSQVHFLGQVEEADKFKVLRMSDIYTSTSQHEGFGIVYLEAMACGLPVVCYDYGGQTDFLESGKTGYLIKLNDLKAFTQAVKELAASPESRKAMGRHNSVVVENYYIDHCAKSYEEVFERAIDIRQSKKSS